MVSVEKQTGGVTGVDVIDEFGNQILYNEPDKLFDYFIRNSTIRIDDITIGSYGIILHCHFQGIESPYVQFRTNHFAERANTLILKLNLISETSLEIEYKSYIENWTKWSISRSDFENEMNIQQDIVSSTIGGLEPISPIIVAGKVLSPNKSIVFLKMIKEKIPNNSDKIRIQHVISNIERFGDASIGYIAMECAGKSENFTNLYDHIRYLENRRESEQILQMKALTIYEIMNLALSGYVQGDHHLSNFLVSTNYRGYFTTSPHNQKYSWCSKLRCLIIDFGRALKLDNTQRNEVRSLHNTFLHRNSYKELKKLMKYIYSCGLRLEESGDILTFDVFNEEPRSIFNPAKKLLGMKPKGKNKYMWIYHDVTPEITEYVIQLYISRNVMLNHSLTRLTPALNGILIETSFMNPSERNSFVPPRMNLSRIFNKGVSKDFLKVVMNYYGTLLQSAKDKRLIREAGNVPVATEIKVMDVANIDENNMPVHPYELITINDILPTVALPGEHHTFATAKYIEDDEKRAVPEATLVNTFINEATVTNKKITKSTIPATFAIPSLFGLLCLLMLFYINANTSHGGNGSMEKKSMSTTSKTKSMTAKSKSTKSMTAKSMTAKSMTAKSKSTMSLKSPKISLRKTRKMSQIDIQEQIILVINAFQTFNLGFIALNNLRSN
jgi:hypothetical protein